MKTPIVPLSFTLIVCLIGCTSSTLLSSGAESQIFDQQALARVSRVALLPLSVSQYSEITDLDVASLSDSLWKELESKRVVSLIPMDSVRSAIRQRHGADSLSELRIARVLSADAFIRAEIVLAVPPSYGSTATATLMLIVNDVKTRKALAYCSFDTFKGMRYVVPPTVDQSSSDAIKGAARTFAAIVLESRGTR